MVSYLRALAHSVAVEAAVLWMIQGSVGVSIGWGENQVPTFSSCVWRQRGLLRGHSSSGESCVDLHMSGLAGQKGGNFIAIALMAPAGETGTSLSIVRVTNVHSDGERYNLAIITHVLLYLSLGKGGKRFYKLEPKHSFNVGHS